jgi:hypothetical protein
MGSKRRISRPGFVLLAALAPALGGCLPDQSKDIAACETEASRFFPVYKAVDPSEPSSQYIIECMATKGYEFTVTPADCNSQHPLPTQAACYTPDNWFAGVYDQARRHLRTN